MKIAFRQRIADIEAELGASAGVDPLADRFKVGAIAAYRDILDVSIEETLDE